MGTELICLAIAAIGGLLMSRLTKLLNLPAVTAYLVAGLLLGPYCLGALGISGFGFQSMEQVEAQRLLTQTALGFIAFSMGNEFRLAQLKNMGSKAIFIGIVQAVVTTLLVDAILVGLHLAFPSVLSLSSALVLGAIASATAPAATLMVINQYKARGPLTDILLPIVALDDAVGLVVFAVSSGIARALISGTVSIVSLLVNPVVEIFGSLLLGAALGWVFSLVEKFFNSGSKRLSLAVAFVIICAALSKLRFHFEGGLEIGFSSLLVTMMCSCIFCNLCDFSEEIMHKTERWTAPIYVLFFVISGAELDLTIFGNLAVVGIGVAYILSRSAGKIFGANVSAKLTRCEPTICKYLGITLLPQAGVALGMSVVVAAEFGEAGAIIRNIVLFSVLIYELVGPLLTKMALTAAGEIKPKPDVKRGQV